MVDTFLEPNKDILERISCCVETDIGIQRESNQDNFTIIKGENFKFFVVCDGMGGINGGEVASQIVISYLEKHLSEKKIDDINKIVKIVNEANILVFNYGMQHYDVRGLGTTITSLFVTPKGSWVLNVGDSRIYKIFKSNITQITEDNTVINELIKSGAVSKDNSKGHPIAHMLTKTMGQGKSLEVDVKRIGFLEKGEKYLLCTDGLYNMIQDDGMLSIIESNSNKEAVKKFIEEANKNGGVDNITAMLIEIKNSIEDTKNDSDVSMESHKISGGLNLDNLRSSVINNLGNEIYTNNNIHQSFGNEKKITKNILSIIIVLLVVLVVFKIFKSNANNNLENTFQNGFTTVEKIGNLQIKDDKRKIKVRLVQKNKIFDNKLFAKYSSEELKAYNALLDMIESNENINEVNVSKEKDILNASVSSLDREISALLEQIEILKKYDGEILLRVARKISKESNSAKKLYSDFVQFSYSLIDNQISQSQYEQEKDKKLDLLESNINFFIENKFKELVDTISKKQIEKNLNKFEIEILNLKQDIIKAKSENDNKKLNKLKLKIKNLKKRSVI